jgi:hypothetical protein
LTVPDLGRSNRPRSTPPTWSSYLTLDEDEWTVELCLAALDDGSSSYFFDDSELKEKETQEPRNKREKQKGKAKGKSKRERLLNLNSERRKENQELKNE